MTEDSLPDWLGKILGELPQQPSVAKPEFPAELRLDLEKLVPRRITVEVLNRFLFLTEAQDHFQQLMRRVGRERTLKGLQRSLQELTFVIYGDIADPGFAEVSDLSFGTPWAVAGGIRTMPSRLETAFILFDFHREVIGKESFICPSGYEPGSGGDLFLLKAETEQLKDQGLTMLPIMGIGRPDRREIMFIQQTPRNQVSLEELAAFGRRPFEDQNEVNQALGEMGYNTAIISYPLKKESILLEMKKFEFEVSRK